MPVHRRMYAVGAPRDTPVADMVWVVPPDHRLDWAITQAENTLNK